MENILFIGDPLSSLKLKSDSSLALAEAALNIGKSVYWCEPAHLCYFNAGLVVLHASKIIKVDINKLDYEKCSEIKIPFSFFHVCFVRKDPPFDEQYKNLCWLLATQQKVKIVNSAHALLSFHEKSLQWRALEEGVLSKENIIPTCYTHDLNILNKFCEDFSPTQKFICKPWLGHGGEDIRLFENKENLLDFLRTQQVENFLTQPFIEEISIVGDRRVIIANGKIICHFVRLPAAGKIAANTAQGGQAVLRDMTPQQLDVSLKIAKFLKEKNILFAGLDLIGAFVGEINITSPTGIRMVETLTDINYAHEIFHLLAD